MTQAVLKITGKVFPGMTTSCLIDAELNSDTKKSKRKKFDDKILLIYGDSMSVPYPICKPYNPELPE